MKESVTFSNSTEGGRVCSCSAEAEKEEQVLFVYPECEKLERTVRIERPRCFWKLDGEEAAEDGGGV
ncbi:hypothetical protein HanIR_Chr17g0883241 [Helianthus annuus]|nr:hypothetical protein HanIR_Chr17g0883241 [Helianthus annuus]